MIQGPAPSPSIHPEETHGKSLRDMKWCLFYVSQPGLDDDFIAQPLGIISIAAILKQMGIDVQCRDERIHTEEEMRDAMDWADVVGFSCMTPFVARSIRWAKYVSKLPGGKIIMQGGPHTMMDPDVFADTGLYHYVFSGEAEESLPEVIDAEGDTAILDDILGIAYLHPEKGKVVNEKRPLLKDLDPVPFPDHDMLPLEPYRKLNPEDQFYIFTSRGCPFTCVFCDKSLTGQSFRTRSVENICDELEQMVDRYNPGSVLFIDELFTCQKQRVTDLCAEIERRKIDFQWVCETRVDMIDLEMANQMYEAGMRRIYFGVESGSDNSLTTLHKQFTRKQVIEALKTMRHANIWTKIFLIFGTPGETAEDIEETRTMLREAHPDAVRTSLFNPLPSTRAFTIWREQIDEEKLLTSFVDSDDSPLIHENFTATELNEIRNQVRADHDAWLVQPKQLLHRTYWRWRFYMQNPRHGWKKVIEKASGMFKAKPRGRQDNARSDHSIHQAGRWADVQEDFGSSVNEDLLERHERIREASYRREKKSPAKSPE